MLKSVEKRIASGMMNGNSQPLLKEILEQYYGHDYKSAILSIYRGYLVFLTMAIIICLSFLTFSIPENDDNWTLNWEVSV